MKSGLCTPLNMSHFSAKLYGLLSLLGLVASTLAQANTLDASTLQKLKRATVPFVVNAGQWDKRAAFAAQTFAGTVFVTTDGALVYSLPGKPIADDTPADGVALPHQLKRGHTASPEQRGPGWALSERFVDGNHKALPATVHGYRPQTTQVSYFISNDESQHKRGVTTYERVNLGDLYPGINVQVRATGNNIEKIFTVAPKQSPKQIQVKLSGATKLEVNAQGELIAHTENGPVAYTAPIAFQEDAHGNKEPVTAAYVLNAEHNTYGFTLAAYDVNRPLTIDPLIQSTYLGTAAEEQANALAIHPATGDVYIAGHTTSISTMFPGVTGGVKGGRGFGDAFVSRFSADLRTLLQSSYLGTTQPDQARAIAISPTTGDVYVAGYTASTGASFPGVSGSAQGASGGGWDVFVSRLSSDLTLLLKSTYLGAAGQEYASALAVHPATGEVYVAGYTNSSGSTFPGVAGGAQGIYGGGGPGDVFVSRFNADLTTLLQSSYLGTGGNEEATALAIHPTSGHVYVAGYTSSSGNSFPGVIGGAQSSFGGGSYDGFVSRFSADLTVLVRSSYIGASGTAFARALAIHPTTGQVYVAGYTDGAVPGSTGGAQGNYGGGYNDAFVVCFSDDLTARISSSHLGGNGADYAYSIAIHPATGDVYIAGGTDSLSNSFPGLTGGAQSDYGGGNDAFVARFSADLTKLIKSTYLGGAGFDEARALAIHAITGDVYVTGITRSDTNTFPAVSGGAQSTYSGGFYDAFVSRFSNLTACNLDMDGDGQVTSAKEWMVLMRASLGLTGSAVTDGTGVTEEQWVSARAQINAKCGTNFPPVIAVSAPVACNLDMDGDTLLTSTKEWLVLLRASLGFTGSATTAGTGISAAQWATARPLINANCGTNFAP